MSSQTPGEPRELQSSFLGATAARPIPETEEEYEHVEVADRPSGCLTGKTLIVLAVIFVIGACVLPSALCVLPGSGLFQGVQRFIDALTSPSAATIASTRTIVQGIQTMGQLVTISVELAKADIGVSVRQGPLGANSFTADHVAQGAVEAGIDLSGITETDIQYDEANDTYTITLPAARLTSCRVGYIRQYAYSGTILPVDRDAARILAAYVALQDFRDTALEGGILERAQQQAQLVLGNFIRALTGSQEVIINFRADAETVLPPSCDPEPPAEWVYIPEQNVWTRP